MNLRDHDRPCEHGFHHYHDRHDRDSGEIHESCFGGAAVDVDYEAAAGIYQAVNGRRPFDDLGDMGREDVMRDVRDVVDAAIAWGMAA